MVIKMKVVIDLPDSLLKEILFGFADPEKEIKFLLAVKLVEMGRISTGRASEWLGISKPRFLQEMGRYGLSALPVDVRVLREDVTNVRESIS
jgi:predicted HTH domain antitoxin